MAKYPGVQVVVSGQTFTLPGMTLRQMRRYFDKASPDYVDGERVGVEHYALLASAVLEALRRNHPDTPDAFLEDSCTPGETLDLWGLMLKQSLATKKDDAEKKEAP